MRSSPQSEIFDSRAITRVTDLTTYHCILINLLLYRKLKLAANVFFFLFLFGRWCEITEERLVSFGHI